MVMRLVTATGLSCLLAGTTVHAQGDRTGNGRPAKFLSSCEADVTGDNRADLIQLVETLRGVELIALVASDTGGYRAFVLRRDKPGPSGILRCEYGPQVTETRAGRGDPQPRVVKTPGAYVHLFFPETSSFAYVWIKDGFVELWTSD
jgi:hypothetical protein